MEEQSVDIPQATKGEAGYIDPPPQRLWPARGKGIRCGTCIYFRDGACDVVEGDIHGQGCCNLWTDDGNEDISQYLSGAEIEDILRDNPDWRG